MGDDYADYEQMVSRWVSVVAETEEKSELQILDDLQTTALGDVICLPTYDPLNQHDHTLEGRQRQREGDQPGRTTYVCREERAMKKLITLICVFLPWLRKYWY
jgi:hypothetical protein